MQTGLYRVDTRMIPPVLLAMGFGLALLALEASNRRVILLALLLAPFFYLGAEILARRISLDDDGITVSKLLRSSRLRWSEIEWIDAVQSGSKLFIILQSSDSRPLLITNTIRPFDDLAGRLMEYVSKEKISSYAAELMSHPPTKHGPLIQAWIVCGVLAACVVGNLLGYS
jgi:hypothetical protein